MRPLVLPALVLVAGCQVLVGVKDLTETVDAGPAPDAIPAAWTVRHSTPIINDLVYANNVFVAVGDYGTILTSSDGANWTTRNSGLNTELHGVAYGSGMWVAGGPANGLSISHDNGVTWSRFGPTPSMWFEALAFGQSNNFFVAADGDRFYSSTDALRWTIRTTLSNNVTKIVWGRDMFVGVGDTGHIYQSVDGVTWTARPYSRTDDFNDVATAGASGALWIAIGNTGLATSTDGLTWTPGTTFTDCCYQGITYSQTNFFVGGTQGRLFRTPDGSNITQITRVTSDDSRRVAFGGGTFVGAGTIIERSSDGTTWSLARSESGIWLHGIAAGPVGSNTAYVAVGGRGHIYTSTDQGNTWNPATVPTAFAGQDFEDVAFGGGKFLATDAFTPRLAASSDGVTWTEVTVPETLLTITYGTQWVVASGNGNVYTSPDGATFTMRTSGVTSIRRLAYGNATYVAVGYNNAVLSSPDGVTWTPRASGLPPGTNMEWVRYVHGQFIAVGNPPTGPHLLTKSTDGITWTRVTSTGGNAQPSNPHSLGWDGQYYILTSFDYPNRYWRSPDLVTWQTLSIPPRTGLLNDWISPSVAGGPRMIAVGDSSTIITVP